MGLACSSRSAICSARVDSATPQNRSIRLAYTPSARPESRSQGAAVACHIACISLGTPGNVSTVNPCCTVKSSPAGSGVQMMPGAVPVGLGSNAAPTGSSA